MWMNESEIEIALSRCQSAPAHVKKAAQFLSDFCDLINSISDGWPHWSYGTKCAEDLQDIIDKAQHPINQYPSTVVHWSVCQKACNKVKTFLKRCRQTKDNPRVQLFLKEH